jgi:hypothetical protein
MMVLACWQTPTAIRHVGVDRITALLRRGHVRNATEVADAMVAAARQQTVTLPGQRAAATVVGQMATEILALDQRIAAVDDLIAENLDQHPVGLVNQIRLRCLRIFVDQAAQDRTSLDASTAEVNDLRWRVRWSLAE